MKQPAAWPRITIITPSYNQGHFIEQTIRSVLDQNYPNLEYWIIDGGSQDQTVDVLRKYSERVFWVSEPDRGQSHAINKGLERSTGAVMGYLNSDDYLEPGSLAKVGTFFKYHPDAFWLSGRCRIIDHNGCEIRSFVRHYKNFWLLFHNYVILLILNYISQPSTFWRREVFEAVGVFNEKLFYTMDYDYWLKIGEKYQLWTTWDYLANFRIHTGSKTGSTSFAQFEEQYSTVMKYHSSKLLFFLQWLHNTISAKIYKFIAG